MFYEMLIYDTVLLSFLVFNVFCCSGQHTCSLTDVQILQGKVKLSFKGLYARLSLVLISMKKVLFGITSNFPSSVYLLFS